ncbi:hypothetical protein N7448_002506 [Penicillium atrosanguineum]|uniref:Uncharacterized protein n=1 Tax=Penicillium atrosanguineum TaxID=1132637 RepID=A0A9W9PUG8_9EURO|nr:uncharacterized protein N7443_005907 [Penicillium atrosanguineum]KAJ5128793.1 hypothetical protein N7526_006959 [Penicillium atrosanguineum]KAJ5145114.1 hypothetical protein N7448_002506 [Penicillium atrosanguineum]KAJ5300905.1 hypothetical protein N7443_005907 [Penicillium atrosanguineum]KAJ5311550.1 hypothetical protein N7476_007410 [Penicillium atrosanguineum]
MINPLKVMASLMKRFKRKRRLSSELHSRWGDPAISYPNEGSWNQRNQPGFAVTTPAEPHHHDRPDEPRRYMPMNNGPTQSIGHPNDLGSHSIDMRDTVAGLPIPKGYFDENIRHRTRRSCSPPARGLGIDDPRKELQQTPDSSDEESCDEEDEERDTFGGPGGSLRHTEIPRPSPQLDSYMDHSSRSPPLSVTSRMRRISMQSSTTEHTPSVAGTTSSRHTSLTAASSVSAPSLPPDTPRYAFNNMHPAPLEKRHAPRPRPREPEPAFTVRHEMVPSYDELYG